MEKLFHARWWDYSNRKFNINGRVCLIGAVVFGTLSLILIKLVHPLVLNMIGMMSDTLFHTIVIALAVIFITDNVVTIAGFCHFDKKIKKFADELKLQTEKLSENITAFLCISQQQFSEISLRDHGNLRKLPHIQSDQLSNRLVHFL